MQKGDSVSLQDLPWQELTWAVGNFGSRDAKGSYLGMESVRDSESQFLCDNEGPRIVKMSP